MISGIWSKILPSVIASDLSPAVLRMKLLMFFPLFGITSCIIVCQREAQFKAAGRAEVAVPPAGGASAGRARHGALHIL